MDFRKRLLQYNTVSDKNNAISSTVKRQRRRSKQRACFRSKAKPRIFQSRVKSGGTLRLTSGREMRYVGSDTCMVLEDLWAFKGIAAKSTADYTCGIKKGPNNRASTCAMISTGVCASSVRDPISLRHFNKPLVLDRKGFFYFNYSVAFCPYLTSSFCISECNVKFL